MSIKAKPCIEERHNNKKPEFPLLLPQVFFSSFSNSLFFLFFKFVKEDSGDCLSLEPSSNSISTFSIFWISYKTKSQSVT